MSPKRLLLVILLATLSGSTIMAQTSQGDARVAITRGNERYARAEYESAVEEYRRVPQSAGEIYAQSLYNIGVCYYELWRTEDAIVFYRRAIEARKGRYPKALYALGVALKDLGRLPEAKEAYRRSIAASGGKYAAAHFMLGL